MHLTPEWNVRQVRRDRARSRGASLVAHGSRSKVEHVAWEAWSELTTREVRVAARRISTPYQHSTPVTGHLYTRTQPTHTFHTPLPPATTNSHRLPHAPATLISVAMFRAAQHLGFAAGWLEWRGLETHHKSSVQIGSSEHGQNLTSKHTST